MWKKVRDHSLFWSREHNSGTVILKLSDETVGEVKHLSKIELFAFSELFRNEPYLWFNTVRGDLTTEKEPDEDL